MTDTLTPAGRERTAIIDVGSNSVRLVIFGQGTRAPIPMLNEKAFCELGLGVAETGKLNPEGVKQALSTLRRFKWLIDAGSATTTIAFATAAVRYASDGPDFVARAEQETGISLRVLSGEKEAELAGRGVLFGIPDAHGIAADMGGSSLELVPIQQGAIRKGASLPLGPLHFSDRRDDTGYISSTAADALQRTEWLPDLRNQTLYLVGGTWRAFAKLDIGMRNYPLNIIHGYEMTAHRARDLASVVARQSPDSLVSAHGISKRRIRALPLTAIILEQLLEVLQPTRLVFSGHGVREGAFFEALSEDARPKDPLLDAIEEIANLETRFSAEAGREIADWIEPLFAGESRAQRRLRRAACMLCDVGWRTHPDYRATQSFRRVLRAPLIGLTHADRCFLAIAVLRRYSHNAGDAAKRQTRLVLSPEDLLTAEKVGTAIRLALTLTGGTSGTLSKFTIRIDDKKIVLGMPDDIDFSAGQAVRSRLKNLAALFVRTGKIE